MTERERLKELLRETFDYTRGVCIEFDEAVEINADHLLENGIIVVDTDHVDVVKNREPLRTAFNMPLDELAELIRAKQEGRLIVPLFTLGQTVYNIEYGIKHVLIGEVYEIVSNEFGIIYRASRKGYFGFSFTAHAIGKTVFLASEDAEKALAERNKP